MIDWVNVRVHVRMDQLTGARSIPDERQRQREMSWATLDRLQRRAIATWWLYPWRRICDG